MPLSVKNIHATIGDYQRNYLYKVFIENVPGVILGEFPEALSFQKEVDIYNKKAIFPNRATERITKNWSGEFFVIPGVDSSTRETDLEFEDDESMICYDFWMALKNLTGNEDNQAGVYGIQSKFNMGVAKISVDKETITAYRRLVGVRVYELDSGEGLSKDGKETTTVKVHIAWDRNVEDKTLRGKIV
jgi:hypothetical protein